MTFNPHIPLRQNGVLNLVLVRRKTSPNNHLTRASGGPEHGSLEGFQTLCGQTIDAEHWTAGQAVEVGDEFSVHCRSCARLATKRRGVL